MKTKTKFCTSVCPADHFDTKIMFELPTVRLESLQTDGINI